jgi:hypothetical protein
MPKTGATSGSAQATNRLARTLRRRDIASRLVQITPYCLASGTLLWSAAVGLSKWTHSPIPAIELAGLIASLSLTAAAYIAWSRARSTTSMLLHADGILRLPSTLTNGSQLQHETGPFAQAAVQASERIARELDHNQLARIAPVWRFTWLQGTSASISLALACAAATFLWLWSPSAVSPNTLSRDAAQALIDQAQQAIAPTSAAPAQALPAPINQDPIAARARAELDAIERELRQGQTTPQDAALRAARTLETAADEAQNAARSQQQTADNTAESLSRAAASASRADSNRDADPPPQDLTKAIAQADLQRAAALAQDLANRPADLSPSQREQLASELQAIADALREDAAQPPQDKITPTSPANSTNTDPAGEESARNSGNDQKPASTPSPQTSSAQSQGQDQGQNQDQKQNQKQDLARSLQQAAESLRNTRSEKNAQDQQRDSATDSDPSTPPSTPQMSAQPRKQPDDQNSRPTPPSQPSPSPSPKATDPAAPAQSPRDGQPNPSPRQNQATDPQSPKDNADSQSRTPGSDRSAPSQTQSNQTTSSPNTPAQDQTGSEKSPPTKSPSEKPDSSSNPSAQTESARQKSDANQSQAPKQTNQSNQRTPQESQQRAPQDNQSFGPQTPRTSEQNGDPNAQKREPQSTPNPLSELAQKLRSVERARQNQDPRAQQWREQAQEMLSKADNQPSQNDGNGSPQSPRPPSGDMASAPPGTSNQPNDIRPGGMQPRDSSNPPTSAGTSPLAGTSDSSSTQSTPRPGASQTIDFNPAQPNSPAAPNDRVIAELPTSNNPSRSSNPPAGTTTLNESLSNARQGADRAIESQSVPREYQDLVRRVFRRYESRASKPTSAPAIGEGKLSPDAAPANPSNSGK